MFWLWNHQSRSTRYTFRFSNGVELQQIGGGCSPNSHIRLVEMVERFVEEN
jgi:hypothetical protein